MGKNYKHHKHRKTQHRQGHHEANGGGAGAMSQAEIWDDSALIRSWNDALQEYEVRSFSRLGIKPRLLPDWHFAHFLWPSVLDSPLTSVCL